MNEEEEKQERKDNFWMLLFEFLIMLLEAF
jgi:hypothetical protein